MNVIDPPAPPPWPAGATLTSGCGHTLEIEQTDVDGGAVTINEDGSATGTCPTCGWSWYLAPPFSEDNS